VEDFGLDSVMLDPIIESGRPFMTSGCPDEHGETACNRPYGNGRPSEKIRNFAFVPNLQDIEDIRTQLWSDWAGVDESEEDGGHEDELER
jgi:biotin synthase